MNYVSLNPLLELRPIQEQTHLKKCARSLVISCRNTTLGNTELLVKIINESSNTNRNVSASQSAQVTGIEDQEVGNKLLSNITTTITRHSLSSLLMKSNSKEKAECTKN